MAATTTPQRALKTFTVRNMRLRDELVVKSQLRMITAGLDARWRYVSEIDADLLIVGDEAGEWQYGTPLAKRTALLQISVFRRDAHAAFLPLPVRLAALRDALSGLDAPTQQGEVHATREPAAAPFTARASVDVDIAITSPLPPRDDQRYQLSRWPRVRVFEGIPDGAKLAAAWLGAPASAPSMSGTTGIPLVICQTFLARAKDDGCMREVASWGESVAAVESTTQSSPRVAAPMPSLIPTSAPRSPLPPPAPAPPPSADRAEINHALLAKLGFKVIDDPFPQPVKTQPIVVESNQQLRTEPTDVKPGRMGLLASIRARLGLGSTKS